MAGKRGERAAREAARRASDRERRPVRPRADEARERLVAARDRVEIYQRVLEEHLRERDEAVAVLRAEGVSWAEISRVAGVSRQALMKRPPVPTP